MVQNALPPSAFLRYSGCMSDSSYVRAVGRAIDDMRRGYDVTVTDAAGAARIVAAEALVALALGWQGGGTLLLTAERARHIGLEAQDAPLVAVALADAGQDALTDFLFSTAPNLSGCNSHPIATPLAQAAVALAREAGWLPAAVIAPVSDNTAEALNAADILAATGAAHELREVSREAIRLPLKYAEHTQIRMFRESLSGMTHLAILVGDPLRANTPPLVRVHSSCFTGDLLGSLRCDCGEQLHTALEAMVGEGGGILLYLNQEGRGIGLAHKLHAYQLQDAGADTVDANEILGFKADERDFTVAAELLQRLGIGQIRLMTNNPAKADALKAARITVEEIVPLKIASNPHNAAYLSTKMTRMEHKLG